MPLHAFTLGCLTWGLCLLQISVEDWDGFTQHGALCDEDDSLPLASFLAAMRAQLSLYAQRLLANKMQQAIAMCVPLACILVALFSHCLCKSLRVETRAP